MTKLKIQFDSWMQMSLMKVCWKIVINKDKDGYEKKELQAISYGFIVFSLVLFSLLKLVTIVR